MRLKHLCLILSIAVISLLSGCSTTPTGHHSLALYSQSQMAQMGNATYAQIKQQNTIETDPALNAYVRCVAKALTDVVGGEWEFTLFRSDQVNAFAVPGGKIGVYSGLLNVARTPDQLAAVLGHEIGHVKAQHVNARMSAEQLGDSGLNILNTIISQQTGLDENITGSALSLGAQYMVYMPYGRSQESEADIIGQNLMARAGFDPKAAITLWHNMQSDQVPQWLSTHPSNENRIARLKDNLPHAQALYNQSQSKPRCPRP